jgi:hypothetical protein
MYGIRRRIRSSIEFFKKTTIFIIKLLPQVIVISYSEEEVEVGPQHVVQE